MRRWKMVEWMMLGALWLSCTPTASAQWVAAARAVRHMRSSNVEVATVLLEAKPEGVYRVALETLAANSKVKISQRDEARRMVEFSESGNDYALQVDFVAAGISQLTIGAPSKGRPHGDPTAPVVQAVERICGQMGVQCTPQSH